jgi:antibiotic biosynthesis monooxygenase (ABM) superfamily enzyme
LRNGSLASLGKYPDRMGVWGPILDQLIKNRNQSTLSYFDLVTMNLTKWENSSIRNEWLQKGKEFVQSDPDVQKLAGLEFWFTPYSKKNSHSMPLNSPRWYKMVLVTIPVITLLLFTLVPQIHLIGESLSAPYSIRFVFAIAIMVLLMTYFIMPLLTKVLRPWLFNS